MEEQNFALLSQDEIDALVAFLNEKNANVETGVLSQESIDRIVELLSLGKKDKTDTATVFEPIESIVDNSAIKGLELKFMEDMDIDQVQIYVVCGDETLYITPLCLEYKKIVDDNSSWGLAIEPRRFNQIADIFKLDYTKDTYEAVVKKFATIMYGNENANIASVYLPDTVGVANHMSDIE